jgi:hypothetical protein
MIINKQDTDWLKQQFVHWYTELPSTKGWLQAYLEAERILKGFKERRHVGCKCEYRVLQQNVDKLYEKFLLDEGISYGQTII